jgi:hypothetical protein
MRKKEKLRGLLKQKDKELYYLIQRQLFQCHREEQRDVAISLIHLKRLPRPFRARNDIVKIYIAFILDILLSKFFVI